MRNEREQILLKIMVWVVEGGRQIRVCFCALRNWLPTVRPGGQAAGSRQQAAGGRTGNGNSGRKTSDAVNGRRKTKRDWHKKYRERERGERRFVARLSVALSLSLSLLHT
jgi:hypothetical protein